jgi:hypothetical protein
MDGGIMNDPSIVELAATKPPDGDTKHVGEIVVYLGL